MINSNHFSCTFQVYISIDLNEKQQQVDVNLAGFFVDTITNTNTTMQKYKYLFGRSVCRTTTRSLIAADIALSGPEGRGRISLGIPALLPANNCSHKHPIKGSDEWQENYYNAKVRLHPVLHPTYTNQYYKAISDARLKG